MKKPISVRTKIEAVIAFVVVGSLIIGGSYAWTIREGEDSTGQIYHGTTDLITCTSGEAWPYTGSNLATAIADADSDGEIIYLPSGGIDLSSDISIDDITIKGVGSSDTFSEKMTQINLTANNTITLAKGGRLQDLNIKASSTHGSEAVVVEGENNFWGFNSVIDNVFIFKDSNNENGTGLLIRADSTSANAHVTLCSFNDIHIRGFETCMKIYGTEPANTAFVNGNQFANLLLSDGHYLLDIESDSGGATNGNMFTNIQLEPAADTIDGIRLYGDTDPVSNMFTNVYAWDWHLCSGYSVNVSMGHGNVFKGFFAGADDIYVDTSLDPYNNIILDAGGSSDSNWDFKQADIKNGTWNDVIVSTAYITPTSTTCGIQEAINDVHGAKLFIPEGTWEITSSIAIGDADDGMTISGAGRDKTIIKVADNTDSTIRVFYNYADNVTIRDLTIDCNADSQGSGDYYGINQHATSNGYMFVENIVVKDSNKQGIQVSPNSKVVDCWVENYDRDGYGIQFAEDCIISNCYIANADKGLYCYETSDVEYNSILHNNIVCNCLDAVGFDIEAHNITVHDNIFKDNLRVYSLATDVNFDDTYWYNNMDDGDGDWTGCISFHFTFPTTNITQYYSQIPTGFAWYNVASSRIELLESAGVWKHFDADN